MNFSQSGDRPDRYREPSLLETIPSSPHLAGMLEYNGALRVLQVLVQPQAWAALAQDARQRRLSRLERLAAQVGADQLGMQF